MLNAQENQTGTRLDLPCAAAGFAAPPCRVELRFVPRGTTWSIEAMTAVDKSTLIARWLQSHNAIRVELGPGLALKTLRADFATLFVAWETLAANRLLHHIDLTPDGTASLFLESRGASVAASVAGLAAGQPVRAREMLAGANQAKVTRRQMDALLRG